MAPPHRAKYKPSEDSMNDVSRQARRRFLECLAASPLMAFGGLQHLLADTAEPSSVMYQDFLDTLGQDKQLITSPNDALSVFDFDAVSRERLSPAHYGYLATGTDNDATVRANRVGFEQFQLRTRRLTGLKNVDTSVRLFDESWETPVILSPIGNQRAFHQQGVLAVARAARKKSQLQILSYGSNFGLQEVIEARGGPVWFQLYPGSRWAFTESVIQRAESAGCPVLVLTVDLAAGHNRETTRRFRQLDNSDCMACHDNDRRGRDKYPTLANIDIEPDTTSPVRLDWKFVDQLKDVTRMKLVIKGIVTREDAALCLEHGVDGIVVSNHGGRAENSGRSTIESLPEVVAAVDGRIPVLIDSGFRRGTDIFKALALGADAVCIGRPYIWGLASFGQPGVEAILDILRRELELVMRQCGTAAVSEIDESFLV